ncbi:FixH family protein [Castellaniella sp.]|uniref:FixH family protein n=1 Tax=Castellaniella sp. TaxID=1955812 RepID=UPI003C779540
MIMMLRPIFFSTVLLGVPLAVPPAAAQAAGLAGRVNCVETGQKLDYACTVRIADAASNEVVGGLAVQVKAGMPSMPMAHNIAPVAARETQAPGVYAFSIKLDMYGKWAFSMHISGPRQELLVDMLDLSPGDGDLGAGGHGHHPAHSSSTRPSE